MTEYTRRRHQKINSTPEEPLSSSTGRVRTFSLPVFRLQGHRAVGGRQQWADVPRPLVLCWDGHGPWGHLGPPGAVPGR